ncbi:hypothetical protein KP509_15G042800 [Ceratopteris richardii]|nr:hypothetical protein KP509_15G042800 [Ceratopteris richardii]
MGNRMNKGTHRGEAEAFKLDALLRLSDVKSSDGKTTLLHFVTEQILKSEGRKIVSRMHDTGGSSSAKLLTSDVQKMENDVKRKGLEVVWQLCTDLQSVKNAANVDADSLNQSVQKLGNELRSVKNTLKATFREQIQSSGGSEKQDTFFVSMEAFFSQAEKEVENLEKEVRGVFDRVKQVTAYFHGNAKEAYTLQLFVIVRDFIDMIEKVCKDFARQLKMNLPG